MSSPVPFQISISDREIARLHNKLEDVRFPDELTESGWDYGVPLSDMKRLIQYWKEKYDWKEQERKINAGLPQFTLDIPVDGFGSLNIHFVHQPSKVENAVPLLFVHGWPGSFLEVSKILPLLTSPTSNQSPHFHVVAYSLPGYGFSQGPTTKGFSDRQYAEVGHKLMQALGYTEYGGDWGHLITRTIAQLYGPKYCKANHTNMGYGAAPKLLSNPILYFQHLLTPYSASEKAGFARTAWFQGKGFGYNVEQSTQPQTLGYSLADSPAGLLAWIYEKLVTWTDGYPWTDDEILTWISIYWFSREGPAASLRIYYEVAQRAGWDPSNQLAPSGVLVGASIFPRDICVFPPTWLRTLANVVFIKVHHSGGHFAAHETPEALVDDMRMMFGRGGAAFGVVKGRSGYLTSAGRSAKL
ncbi:Alpha/Beta hydrolase protein [Hysterangium stoloniferum]|nr:Alpha/Beta hydrolase protein [Hysterangium stoloniferum]